VKGRALFVTPALKVHVELFPYTVTGTVGIVVAVEVEYPAFGLTKIDAKPVLGMDRVGMFLYGRSIVPSSV
jgi:hypothetical protein